MSDPALLGQEMPSANTSSSPLPPLMSDPLAPIASSSSPASASAPPDSSPPVAVADYGASLPATVAPSAPLKPLLNPLQNDSTPPASTRVEPPRSPNPANPATDDRGRNTDFSAPSSGPGSAVGPPEDYPAPNGVDVAMVNQDDQPPLPIDAPVPPSPPVPKDEIPPVIPPGLIPSAVATPTRITVEDPEKSREERSLQPSPSPVPPPQPENQASLSSGVNRVEDLLGQGPPAATSATESGSAQLSLAPPPFGSDQVSTSPLPAASPSAAITSSAAVAASPAPPAQTPSASVATPPAPPAQAISTQPAAPAEPPRVENQADDSMDIDAVGEEEEEPAPATSTSAAPPLQSASSSSSLKRPGEALQGPEEKRAKEATPAGSSQTPVAPAAPGASAPNSQAVGAAPVAYVPVNYVPPPPRDAGPTTPLTPGQYKHLLATIRSMKKMKEAVPFSAPVDIVLFQIPHYPNIVKNPMDLGTVETKLVASNPSPPKGKPQPDQSKGRYGSVSEVVNDVRQVWENTRMFNGPVHVVSEMATKLEGIFEKALSNLPADAPSAQPSPAATPTATAPAAGPSSAHNRRPSISHPPAPRRSSDAVDRPKREIHPPPSKELPYASEQARKKRRNDPQINYCARILKQLENQEVAMGAFLFPIGELIEQLPAYLTVIKSPIDLNIIKDQIANGVYDDAAGIHADVKRMFGNAMKFNPPNHEVHVGAKKLLDKWEAAWRDLPPKEAPKREISEDPLAGDVIEEQEEDDYEDDDQVIFLRKQIANAEEEIRKYKLGKRKAAGGSGPRASMSKKAKASGSSAAARKQSMSASQSKTSPGINGTGNGNGNGHAGPKKPRKSKEQASGSYREDDAFGYESEEEVTSITLTQKQELAEKITHADPDTLSKAIEIITKSTGMDGTNEEIELDIESLPARTVVQLYNLVCRGRAPNKKGRKPKGVLPAAPGVGGAKKGRKPGKRGMNEQEEADRIRRMEAQLQSFGPGGGGGAGMGRDTGGYDSDSSEEEESEEE